MASATEQLRALSEARLNVWSQAQELLDRAVDAKRGMTAEEQTSYDRMTEELDRYDDTIKRVRESETTQRDIETMNEEFSRVQGRDVTERHAEDEGTAELRSFFRPLKGQNMKDELRACNNLELDIVKAAHAYEAAKAGASELRAILGDSGASGGSLTIPTLVATNIYAFITNRVAMRLISKVFPTAGGNPMNFPRVATHGIATQVATQNTTLAGTDAVLSQMVLNSYDYAQLVAVSNDLLEDSGSDVVGFVAENVGRAIAQVIGTAYVTGSGSSAPQGIQGAGAVGGAGTIATGGSLILGPNGNSDPNSLIDLQYSISDGYAADDKAWLFNRKTVAVLRKMRDGSGGTVGQFLWQPSLTVGLQPGQPDRFLGDPVYSDPNVASMASDAKIGFYGAFSTAFYIRDVGNFSIERSNDIYFDKNQVAFRGIWRTDSDLIDTTAINTLHQAVT